MSATVTEADRAAAHALAGLRMDGWCSWIGADVHGEQCSLIAQAIADARGAAERAGAELRDAVDIFLADIYWDETGDGSGVALFSTDQVNALRAARGSR